MVVWLFNRVYSRLVLGQAMAIEERTEAGIGDSFKLIKEPTMNGSSVTKAEHSQSAWFDLTRENPVVFTMA